ncbi:YcxB family protein [Paenibacillus sp. S28]|uniref:YcxB family protein n=1 Tax=Paenibacillus sp. S28 TaxID=2767463 RepID=UPI00190DB665|nr:YcxB family protein [Paenibacillus sp. S28]MBJ9993632.1 YcxB family protein [Paenibacillus sp. S28]
MVISFDINKEDYWKFNKHVIMNNLKYKRRFLTSLILLPVVMSIIFMLMQLPTWYSWTAGIILGLGVHVYSYKRFKRRVLSLLDDKPGLLGEHTITLADEGIIENTSVNESIHKWPGIRSIEHNDEYIFIFLNQTMAHIIPKRAFESSETAAVFLKEAQSKWERESRRTA